MAASLKLLPGSTVRWRGLRYLIVDYESLDAIIARQPGKRRLERIPVNEAAPDHASHIVSAWVATDAMRNGTERSASPKRSLPHATMCLRPHESSDQFPADALRYRAPSRSSARFVIPTRKSSPSPGGLWSCVDIPVVALLAPSRASKRT